MSEITMFGHLPSKVIIKFVKRTFSGKSVWAFNCTSSLGLKTYEVSKKLLNFPNLLNLGCPRNKQTKFSVRTEKTKINLFRLLFGLFRETKKFFFRFVSVFLIHFGCSYRTSNARLYQRTIYQLRLYQISFMTTLNTRHQWTFSLRVWESYGYLMSKYSCIDTLPSS
jgi:hypothetical protein